MDKATNTKSKTSFSAELLSAEFSNDVDALEWLEAAARRRLFRDSLSAAHKAVEAFPGSAILHHFLARTYNILCDYEVALVHLDSALKGGLPAASQSVNQLFKSALACDVIKPVMRIRNELCIELPCDIAELLEASESVTLKEGSRAPLNSIESPLSMRQAFEKGDFATANLILKYYIAHSTTQSELEAAIYHAQDWHHSTPLGYFASWSLVRRFPGSVYGKILSAQSFLNLDDALGAASILQSVILSGEASNLNMGHDVFLKLALSCSAFGTLQGSLLLAAGSIAWGRLYNKNLVWLSAAHLCNRKSQQAASALSKLPRIALCISGQLRNHEAAWKITQEALLGYEIQVFLFTWNKVASSFGGGSSANTVERRLGPYARHNLPPESIQIRLFTERYPKAFRVLCPSEQLTTEAECRELYQTTLVTVEDETEFDRRYAERPGLLFNGNLNSAKMFYGIHRALGMMNSFEKQSGELFDVIVRARPDTPIHNIGNMDINRAAHQEVVLSHATRSGVIGDIFLVMNRGSSAIVRDMWTEFDRKGSFGIVPGASGAAAERALFESVAFAGHSCDLLDDSRIGGLGELNSTPLKVLYQSLLDDLIDSCSSGLRCLDNLDLSVASALSIDAVRKEISSIENLKNIIDLRHQTKNL